MNNIVVVGAGTAGTMMSSRLSKTLSSREWSITCVDRNDEHIYQPGLLFVPFGGVSKPQLHRSRVSLLPPSVTFKEAAVRRIVPDENRVELEGGESLPYDIAIVATGSRTAPEATEGLMGHGWNETAFDLYSVAGASGLIGPMAAMTRGRLVIDVVSMPIKCPVAPLEYAFLADAFFSDRGVRDDIEIVYATPLDAAFTKPVASRMLGDLLQRKRIELQPDFAAAKVDGRRRILESYDGRGIDYDLLVVVPEHYGAKSVMASGLGDEMGFIPTDAHTLRSIVHENLFVLGDATNLPISKAGAVAHFQSEVLHDNILRHIAGQALLPAYDGHANCFIETGHDKAMLIDFNYATEPLPGRYPLPGIGPFSLLAESHINHWGKLAFEWLYWNVLLRGAPLPLDHRMLTAGKWGLK